MAPCRVVINVRRWAHYVNREEVCASPNPPHGEGALLEAASPLLTMDINPSTSSRVSERPVDPALRLEIPINDVASPDMSIVVPALNEKLTIGDFIDWCKEGLSRAGVVGEILIVDSSTDNTADIALSKGARVLRAPKRGLGRAYIDSLPFIRGKWIVMGDCDCTYDFREIEPFVAKFRDGAEFIMGSR